VYRPREALLPGAGLALSDDREVSLGDAARRVDDARERRAAEPAHAERLEAYARSGRDFEHDPKPLADAKHVAWPDWALADAVPVHPGSVPALEVAYRRDDARPLHLDVPS
jgi:hypothetical protein